MNSSLCASLTGGVIVSSLCSFRLCVDLHFSSDSAYDTKLWEQGHPLWALKFSSAASEVVNAAQADFWFLWLQHHHITFSIWNGYAGVLVGTSGEDLGIMSKKKERTHFFMKLIFLLF